MVKIIIGFILIFLSICLGATAFTEMNGRERFELTKLLSYASIIALVTVIIVSLIVVFL